MEFFYGFVNILGWLVILGVVLGGLWLFWALLVGSPRCRAHATRNCGYCEYYADHR